MKFRLFLNTAFIVGGVFLGGCSSIADPPISPSLSYIPNERLVASWEPTFPPLSLEEKVTDWGKELQMGILFGKELDLYRAIGAFKRASFLSPPETRKQEIDFFLFFSYYLAAKYEEALSIFESSSISSFDRSFPAFKTLLTSLYECYTKIGKSKSGKAILEILRDEDEETARRLEKGFSVETIDWSALSKTPLYSSFSQQAKSISKARFLQACLPGAGYLYMGQPKSALTSFILNGLFIWGTAELFLHGHTAWALFTLSLESGWYIGGINGVGLLAKQHNETLYSTLGREYMMQERLFPILQIQKGF